jgi:hypothetical protein
LLDLTQGLFEELCHKGSLAHRSREITCSLPLVPSQSPPPPTQF